MRDLQFLREFSDIEGVQIVHPPIPFELSPLGNLKHLRRLVNSGPPTPIALHRFSKLEEFRGYWHQELRLSECKQIRLLDLSGYKSAKKTLEEFPKLPKLTDLTLVQANIESLQGISRFKTLLHLSLAYMTALKSLEDVQKLDAIEILDCNRCRKLSNHDLVSKLTNLRILRLNDCSEIQSLKFLNLMPSLEEFRFVNSNVQDGDLHPLMRLKRVGFFPKRHYSHTPEEINEVIRLEAPISK